MTGSEALPIPVPAAGLAPLGRRPGDIENVIDDRTYLWRQEVLSAEPANEIEITRDELTRVEAQLAHYELK
jgi:hypothetical protein